MTEDIVELARAIHKCKPNATMHVTVWLRDYSAENVETLSSKGLKGGTNNSSSNTKFGHRQENVSFF